VRLAKKNGYLFPFNNTTLDEHPAAQRVR